MYCDDVEICKNKIFKNNKNILFYVHVLSLLFGFANQKPRHCKWCPQLHTSIIHASQWWTRNHWILSGSSSSRHMQCSVVSGPGRRGVVTPADHSCAETVSLTTSHDHTCPHMIIHWSLTCLIDSDCLSEYLYQFSERYQMITTCPHCSSVKTFESTVLLNMNKWVSGVQVTEIVTILSGKKMVNPHLTVSNNFLVIILLHATILAAHNSPSQQRKEKCENIQNLDFFISCKSTQSMRATLF